MDKKLLKQYINRTGFQRAGIVGSNPLLRGTTGPNQILKAPRGYTGMQEILAGGALGAGASKFLKDEDKENLPVETEETKLPKKEPPEGEPDLLPELTKQTAEEVIRKEIKEKEKSSEYPNVLPEELTLEKVRSHVKFKQSKFRNTIDVFYKGKKYAEIEKRSDRPKFRGLFDYDLKFPSGYFLEDGEEVFETQDAEHGLKDAKEIMVNSILSDLISDFKRNKKSMGGMIDSPLPGRSRYI